MQKKHELEQQENNTTTRRARRVSRRGKSSNAFKTISEVASLLKVEQHVLRFWETKFKQVEPMKRGGGRRYYRPEDVELLTQIHKLLYNDGYTIKGVQKLLADTKGKLNKEQPAEIVVETKTVEKIKSEESQDINIRQNSVSNVTKKYKAELKNILGDLKEIRSMVNY